MDQTGFKVLVLKNFCKWQDKQIKFLSFHSYLRKISGGMSRGKFAPLRNLCCRVVHTARCSHQPYPQVVKKLLIVSLRSPLLLALPGRDFNLIRQKILIVHRAVLIWTGCVRTVRNV
jgi:hypothetical protein